jgi:hypothetical protein
MKKFRIEELVKLSESSTAILSINLLYEQQDKLFDKANNAVFEFINYKNYETNFDEEKFYELRDYANKCIKDKLYMYYNQELIHEAELIKEALTDEEFDFEYYGEHYRSLEAWMLTEGKEMEERLTRNLANELITDEPNETFNIKLNEEQFNYILDLAEDIIPFGYVINSKDYIIKVNIVTAKQMKNLLKAHDEELIATKIRFKIEEAVLFN